MWWVMVSAALAGPGPPLGSIAELTDKAASVCVGTVVSVHSLPDTEEITTRQQAKLRDIQALSGKCPSKATLDYLGHEPRSLSYARHRYALEVGAAYLLFVDEEFALLDAQLPAVDAEGLLRMRPDASGPTVNKAVWRSLTDDVASSNAQDATRALGWLDRLSMSYSWMPEPDFDRRETVDTAIVALGSESAEVREATLDFLGSGSWVYREQDLVFWLESLNPGSFPRHSVRDLERQNFAAVHHYEAIASAASRLPAEQKAKAIRCLHRSQRTSLPELEGWLTDSEPVVRAGANLLIPDLPPADRHPLLKRASQDADATVRAAAATAMALGQDEQTLPLIELLLEDPEVGVQRSAAQALLAVATGHAHDALERQADHELYGGLFVNSLAETDAVPWRSRLTENVETRYSPAAWWGGFVPHAHSWALLFEDLSKLATTELESAAVAPALHALEHAKFHGSSEPRDLYQLYHDRGMDSHAKAFRAHVDETVGFDMSLYLDRVDASAPRGGP